MTPPELDGFPELSIFSSTSGNLLQMVETFLELVSFLSLKIR